MVRYEIEVIDRNPDDKSRVDMDGIRLLCADLIEGIDQRKDTIGHGEDGMDHSSIFVKPKSVGEAVRRINEAGFATDEDTAEESR